MVSSAEIRRQVVLRLRELFPRAKAWEEVADARIGSQKADLSVKFRLGEQERHLVIEVSSLGQPRQIRAAVTRLAEIRKESAAAYPVAAAVYIGSQSARILKDNGLGFLDLSGNCYLAFDQVLIEKEGKRNVRPSTRPLRSLFAPRATRVVRVLLAEPGRAWRLEELARAAEVSLGHSHNVVKRLEDLRWVERDDAQRIHLGKPADLLDAWSESYSYRAHEIASYFAPERITRKFMSDIARVATAEGRRYAFTLNAGLSLVTGQARVPAVHVYLEGDPAPVAAALGLRPVAHADGALHVLTPNDPGVFYGVLEKAGLKVVSMPQLYADLKRFEARGAQQAEHLRREAIGY
jgi:transcriptional regulator with AbiEi antitoxin domain of type IV toxin-antitoxin system